MSTIRIKALTIQANSDGWRLRTEDGLEDSGDWPTEASKVLQALVDDAGTSCSCHLSNLFEPRTVYWAQDNADGLRASLEGLSVGL